MLSDNREALVRVKSFSPDKIRELVSCAYLYGKPGTLGSLLNRPYRAVLGALYNADTDGELSRLGEMNPHGIVAGLSAAAALCGAGESVLVLPSGNGFTQLRSAAEKAGITVADEDFIDCRAHADDLLLHWAALAAVADLIIGEPQRIITSVNSRLTEVMPGEPVGSVMAPGDVKAVRIGASYYTPSVMSEPARAELFAAGGVIKTYGSDCCIVQAAYEQIMRLRKRCCGKCLMCREGLFQFGEILREITKASSNPAEPALAKEIGEALAPAAHCSVGEAAAECMLTVLENFSSELDSHIKKKVCPAAQCAAFSAVYIDPMKCCGCGDCIAVCPEDCIEGKPGYISMIDDVVCTKCGKCAEVCPEGAVVRTQSRIPRLPDRLTKAGRFRR
ncbi:MAG: 4Fe-4S binding protein [Clostridiales bacterium]|nr:4Fe-4S binding protein [Clostridiales bacterium]